MTKIADNIGKTIAEIIRFVVTVIVMGALSLMAAIVCVILMATSIPAVAIIDTIVLRDGYTLVENLIEGYVELGQFISKLIHKSIPKEES